MLGGAPAGADLPRLCARVQSLLERSDGEAVVCDVGDLAAADVGTLDLLARLQLTAGRSGARISLRGASPQLVELVALCGLGEALPLSPPADDPAGRTAETALPSPETR